MEIYKRNILGEKVRKHAFDQEKKVISKEKGRKHELDQEKKRNYVTKISIRILLFFYKFLFKKLVSMGNNTVGFKINGVFRRLLECESNVFQSHFFLHSGWKAVQPYMTRFRNYLQVCSVL